MQAHTRRELDKDAGDIKVCMKGCLILYHHGTKRERQMHAELFYQSGDYFSLRNTPLSYTTTVWLQDAIMTITGFSEYHALKTMPHKCIFLYTQ